MRRRLSSQAASKNKSNSVGPLSEISIADRLTPQIWKRIHIQKPSGVHTKIFLAGRPEGFATVASLPSVLQKITHVRFTPKSGHWLSGS